VFANSTLASNYSVASNVLWTDPSNSLAVATKTAIGASYCSPIANKPALKQLFGYNNSYCLANGGSITPDSVRCFSNTSLAIYPSAGCTGNPTI
jgi:hypothetical protein